MIRFNRRALISVIASVITMQASLAFANGGADGIAMGSVAVSLQIQQQCAISSLPSGANTATEAPVVTCDFDQPYQTLLSSDAPSESNVTPQIITTSQTREKTQFWTVVF